MTSKNSNGGSVLMYEMRASFVLKNELGDCTSLRCRDFLFFPLLGCQGFDSPQRDRFVHTII